jgi:hypothetical protein
MAPPRKQQQEEEEMVAGGGEAAALRAPADVIARVFSQLDCVDLLSCSLVCRSVSKHDAIPGCCTRRVRRNAHPDASGSLDAVNGIHFARFLRVNGYDVACFLLVSAFSYSLDRS